MSEYILSNFKEEKKLNAIIYFINNWYEKGIGPDNILEKLETLNDVQLIMIKRSCPQIAWLIKICFIKIALKKDYSDVCFLEDQIIQTVKHYPDQDWDFAKLSRYPGLFVFLYPLMPSKNWDFNKMSQYKEILPFVKENPQANWDWRSLSYLNLSGHWDLVMNFPEKDWDWTAFSPKKHNYWSAWDHIPPSNLIDAHIDKPWDFPNLRKVDLSVVSKYPNKPWNYYELTRTAFENQNLKILKDFPDKDWDWDFLTERKDPNWIKALPDGKWNWNKILSNPTVELVIAFPDKNWDLTKIDAIKVSYSSIDKLRIFLSIVGEKYKGNISCIIKDNIYPVIEEFPDFNWDWSYFAYLAPWSLILKLKHKPWNWQNVRDADWEFVFANPDLGWHSLNYTNLTEEMVLKNPKFNWDMNKLYDKFPDLYLKTPNWSWNWQNISKNVNWIFVDKYEAKNWNWDVLLKRTDIPEWFNFSKAHISSIRALSLFLEK